MAEGRIAGRLISEGLMARGHAANGFVAKGLLSPFVHGLMYGHMYEYVHGHVWGHVCEHLHGHVYEPRMDTCGETCVDTGVWTRA